MPADQYPPDDPRRRWAQDEAAPSPWGAPADAPPQAPPSGWNAPNQAPPPPSWGGPAQAPPASWDAAAQAPGASDAAAQAPGASWARPSSSPASRKPSPRDGECSGPDVHCVIDSVRH